MISRRNSFPCENFGVTVWAVVKLIRDAWVDVNEDTDILTLNIQAQVDQDRNTQILQNLADPSSQPSAISTPTLGCSVLIDRQQPSHRFILVSTTKSFNHRSNEVPNVSLASATEESNRPWRRMPECAICIQLGHMAQTGPRRYTAQPPSQVSPLQIVHGNNFEDITIYPAHPQPCGVQVQSRLRAARINTPNYTKKPRHHPKCSPRAPKPYDRSNSYNAKRPQYWARSSPRARNFHGRK